MAVDWIDTRKTRFAAYVHGLHVKPHTSTIYADDRGRCFIREYGKLCRTVYTLQEVRDREKPITVYVSAI